MQRQFSQPTFSPAPNASGYLYEEIKSPLWRRILPIGIVLVIGAAACYGGLNAGKKMAGEVTRLDTVQADPQLTQRVTIGADSPDLMMPQPTFAPPTVPTVIAVVQPKPVHRATRRANNSRAAQKPAFDPFSDNSIPFRPAEDYAPEATHEKQGNLNAESPDIVPTVDQVKPTETPSTENSEPGVASVQEQVSESESPASPVPVAE